MIEKLFDSTFTVLKDAMDVRAERQQVLSSNIANQETPGYRARDIHFEKELQRRISSEETSRWGISTTNPRHIPVRPVNFTNPVVVTRASDAAGYDNNSVGIEAEMVKLSENSLMYSIAAKMIRSKFGMIMSAIKEGGR